MNVPPVGRRMSVPVEGLRPGDCVYPDASQLVVRRVGPPRSSGMIDVELSQLGESGVIQVCDPDDGEVFPIVRPSADVVRVTVSYWHADGPVEVTETVSAQGLAAVLLAMEEHATDEED